MKSKQIANIIIKFAGIYYLIEATPAGITWMIGEIQAWIHSESYNSVTTIGWAVGLCVKVFGGLLLILKSQKIAEFLFKNEDE